MRLEWLVLAASPVYAEIPVVWPKMPFAQCCAHVTKRTGIKPSGHLFQEFLFSLWPCVHFKCLLSQRVPHLAATSKRGHFSASLSPLYVLCVHSFLSGCSASALCVCSVLRTGCFYFLYCNWRLIEVFQARFVWGWTVSCVTQEWWTSFVQHPLCASERFSCICREDSVFLMLFNTHKEEGCKLTRF